MDPWHWRLFCLLFCREVYFLLSEIRTYTTPTIQNPQPECMYAMNVRCWYIHKVFNRSILKQVLVVADRLVYTCSVHTLFIYILNCSCNTVLERGNLSTYPRRGPSFKDDSEWTCDITISLVSPGYILPVLHPAHLMVHSSSLLWKRVDLF